MQLRSLFKCKARNIRVSYIIFNYLYRNRTIAICMIHVASEGKIRFKEFFIFLNLKKYLNPKEIIG